MGSIQTKSQMFESNNNVMLEFSNFYQVDIDVAKILPDWYEWHWYDVEMEMFNFVSCFNFIFFVQLKYI